MNFNVNLLYFSATDTTKKVIRNIAKGINNDFIEYNLTLPSNRQQCLNFTSKDLVIIGVPVYAGRVPKFLSEYLANIKGDNTPAVYVAVYGNRHYDDALLELKNIMENNRFIGVAGGAFIGEHSYTTKLATGRPDRMDLEIARNFGTEIKDKLSKYQDILLLPKIEVKGNYPYKERKRSYPMVPETRDVCIKCGICAANCPMGAIDFNNFEDIDQRKCIKCSSCVKKCPVSAKSINHPDFIKITQYLIDNFSIVRHEPELFI